MTKIITELVEITALENKSDSDIIEMSEKMAGFFINECEGCIDCELVKDETNNKWMTILHWESKEKLDEAGKKMKESFLPKLFAENMVMESLKLTFAAQINIIR